MKKLFWLAVVLNLLDLTGTLILLKLGATEANPLMAALIGKSVWLFVGVKALVVPSAAWLLYKSKSKKLLWTCCAAYGLVCCLHIFLLVTHAF